MVIAGLRPRWGTAGAHANVDDHYNTSVAEGVFKCQNLAFNCEENIGADDISDCCV